MILFLWRVWFNFYSLMIFIHRFCGFIEYIFLVLNNFHNVVECKKLPCELKIVENVEKSKIVFNINGLICG